MRQLRLMILRSMMRQSKELQIQTSRRRKNSGMGISDAFSWVWLCANQLYRSFAYHRYFKRIGRCVISSKIWLAFVLILMEDSCSSRILPVSEAILEAHTKMVCFAHVDNIIFLRLTLRRSDPVVVDQRRRIA